eukprot:gb/GFBE01046852.1/.p1 GENE.gb/GFBE01046852.1/~~gb/GFBE01046852.1/.p1  ORF type:complete len:102 (+),score=15.30 gb/GFBE01046852.1/:1-306(+)
MGSAASAASAAAAASPPLPPPAKIDSPPPPEAVHEQPRGRQLSHDASQPPELEADSETAGMTWYIRRTRRIERKLTPYVWPATLGQCDSKQEATSQGLGDC